MADTRPESKRGAPRTRRPKGESTAAHSSAGDERKAASHDRAEVAFGAGIFDEPAPAAPPAAKPTQGAPAPPSEPVADERAPAESKADAEPLPVAPPAIAALPEAANVAEATAPPKPITPADSGARPPMQRRPHHPDDGGGPRGFDEETNSRYEEIKRGSTHITELQQ